MVTAKQQHEQFIQSIIRHEHMMFRRIMGAGLLVVIATIVTLV